MQVTTDVRSRLLFISSLFLTAFFAAATETKWFVFRTDLLSVASDYPRNYVIAASAVCHKQLPLIKSAFRIGYADNVNVHAASLMLHRYGFLFVFNRL